MVNLKSFTKYRLLSVMATVACLLVIQTGIANAAEENSPGSTTTKSVSTQQQEVSNKCDNSFFGLEPWWQYMYRDMSTTNCDITCFNVLPVTGSNSLNSNDASGNDCAFHQQQSDIVLILLAVIDDLLRIVGILTVGFVIFGSFKYVTSQGSADAVTSAKNTIINALIGMAIASIAVVLVNFLGNSLG